MWFHRLFHFTKCNHALIHTVIRTNIIDAFDQVHGMVFRNALPRFFIDVSNLPSFKNGLRKYLLDNYGSFILLYVFDSVSIISLI